jgi:N-ethylmaleimide reductase
MNQNINLLTPIKLGPYKLPNRIIMAPLTRMRAGEGKVPQPVNAEYYAQRASAGLIISEASQVSPQGTGYVNTPGIYSPEQVEGWKLVTEAVHQKGGHIFLQLWHVGRISHPSLQPNGELPVAPSAIAAEGSAVTYEGLQPFVTPRALETDEIPQIVQQYATGAKNALLAGFDGVEIHSANGYLLDQFLQDGTNKRTDQYGGSLENRMRLLKEVTEAVIKVWGGDKVGIRLSPSGSFNSMTDSDPKTLFSYVVKELNQYNLAYLHLVEPRVNGSETLSELCSDLTSGFFRSLYQGLIMTAGGYDQSLGNEVLENGEADLVAYGRLFISNPDLPLRFAKNAELNPYNRSTFYGGDEKGYIDYPFLQET